MKYEIKIIMEVSMVEGKYNIKLNTPRGIEKGSLVIIQQGASIMGYLNYMGTNYKFSSGKVNGYDFEFSGEFKWLFMRVPYVSKGQVIRDKLTGVVYTKYGNFPVEGIKV